MLSFAFGLDPDPILESRDDPKDAVLVDVVSATSVGAERGFDPAKLHTRGQPVSSHLQTMQYGILGLGGQPGFLQLQLSS